MPAPGPSKRLAIGPPVDRPVPAACSGSLRGSRPGLAKPVTARLQARLQDGNSCPRTGARLAQRRILACGSWIIAIITAGSRARKQRNSRRPDAARTAGVQYRSGWRSIHSLSFGLAATCSTSLAKPKKRAGHLATQLVQTHVVLNGPTSHCSAATVVARVARPSLAFTAPSHLHPVIAQPAI